MQIIIDAEHPKYGHSLIDLNRRWVKYYEYRKNTAHDNYVKKECEEMKSNLIKKFLLILNRSNLIQVANYLVKQNEPHYKFDILLSLLFD